MEGGIVPEESVSLCLQRELGRRQGQEGHSGDWTALAFGYGNVLTGMSHKPPLFLVSCWGGTRKITERFLSSPIESLDDIFCSVSWKRLSASRVMIMIGWS